MNSRDVLCIFLIILLVSTFRITLIFYNGAVRKNRVQSIFLKDSNFETYNSEIDMMQEEIDKERLMLKQLINRANELFARTAPHAPHTTSREKQISTSSNVSKGTGVIAKSVQNKVKGVGFDLNVTKPLCYDRALKSGFGDRLSVYMTLAAIGRALKREVYAYWHEENGKEHYKLNLTKIRQLVSWPQNLHILHKYEFLRRKEQCILIHYWMHERDKTKENKHLLASNKAYDGVYTLARRTYGLPSYIPTITQEEFTKAYRAVTGEFTFKIKKDKNFPQGHYVALHVRGGDKRSQITNFNTIEILQEIQKKQKGQLKLVVVTDDENLLSKIREQAKNLQVVHNIGVFKDKHEAMIYDLNILFEASFIIQHSPAGWSAFSSTAAMARQIPLLNTFTPNSGLQRLFADAGGCPKELNSVTNKLDVRDFMQAIQLKQWSDGAKSMRDALGQSFHVSNKIDIENVQQIQRRLLRLLEILDKLSQEHGFTYWVCGGTLLGAKRHSGFIPYDADIDVGMNMKDYNKLKSLASKKFPGDIWLQDAESDKYYKGSKAVYAKIRDLNTDYVEWSKTHKDWHNGIQLDIFVQEYSDNVSCGKPAAGLVFPVKRMPFENITVNIPAQAETLLKKQYHKWMQLPAVGRRIHHQGRVEFSAPTWVKMKYPELYPSGVQ